MINLGIVTDAIDRKLNRQRVINLTALVSKTINESRYVLNDVPGNGNTPRWSDAELLSTISAGIDDIRKRRYDSSFLPTTLTAITVPSPLLLTSELPLHEDYFMATVHYVVYRCYEQDADKKSGNMDLSKYHQEQYEVKLLSAPWNYNDEEILSWLWDGVYDLIMKRPDLQIDDRRRIIDFDRSLSEIELDQRWSDALIQFVIYRALKRSGQDKEAELQISRYKREVEG